jgi:hypothetical protein
MADGGTKITTIGKLLLLLHHYGDHGPQDIATTVIPAAATEETRSCALD